MNKPMLMFFTIVTAVLPPALFGQGSAAAPAAALIRESAASAADDYTPSALVMIENRARVLGNRASASGTHYFELRTSDLIGKTQEEVLQRLSPSVINAGGLLRKMEIVVDLESPLSIYATKNQPVTVGTAVLQGPVRNVEVHTHIVSSDIRIINRK